MKNRTIAAVVAAVVVVVAIGGFALAHNSSPSSDKSSNSDSMDSMDMDSSKQSQSTDSSSTPAVATETVEISNFAYSPANITVKKGTTVTWTNKDSVRHDIMADDGDKSGLSSDLLAQGGTYKHTFDTVGTFHYHCSPHPYMKGTVTVTE